MSGSFYDQTADGLIGHTMLPGIKVLLDQVLSLHVFPGKNQFTHLGQTYLEQLLMQLRIIWMKRMLNFTQILVFTQKKKWKAITKSSLKNMLSF